MNQITTRFDPLSFQTDKHLTDAHRTETGSFYTPYGLALWMVKTTLDSLVAAYVDDCNIQGHEPKVTSYLEMLKVLEPSCGSGVFACAFLACCETYYAACVDSEEAIEIGSHYSIFPIQKYLKNIYACDIQSDPLRRYQNNVSNAYGILPSDVPVYHLDILCNEGIEMYSELAGAFGDGFDLVFGNPPYLGEKSNKTVFQNLRQTDFGKKYYEGKMDYFYFFAYRGIDCLKPGGRLCFITTNYFPTADGAIKFRNYLKVKGHFSRIINFGEAVLFSDAIGQNNMVWEYQKNIETLEQQECMLNLNESRFVEIWSALNKKSTLDEISNTNNWSYHTITEQDFYDSHGCMQLHCSKEESEVLDYLASVCEMTLGECCEVNQGIVSGADKDFKNKQGIFVLTPDEVNRLAIEEQFLQPFYKSKDVKQYRTIRQTVDFILYLTGLEDKETFEKTKTYEHLLAYKERLSKRREVENGLRPWFALQWPREDSKFRGEKIVVPQRSNQNTFAYTTTDIFGSADLYYIAAKPSKIQMPLKALTGYLNSKVIYFWLYYAGKRKGKMLELYSTPLKKIPVPSQWDASVWSELENLTEAVLSQLSLVSENEYQEANPQAIQHPVDEFLYKHLRLPVAMIELIENHYKKNFER